VGVGDGVGDGVGVADGVADAVGEALGAGSGVAVSINPAPTARTMITSAPSAKKRRRSPRECMSHKC
jgi:hypothetical protein